MVNVDKQLKVLFKTYQIAMQDQELIRNFMVSAKDYLSFLQKFEYSLAKCPGERLGQKEFDKAQEKIIASAYTIECKIASSTIKEKIREIFRNTVGKYIYQSEILKRAYEKPRGYPGDSWIFEMIYGNKPISKGVGYYLDSWILTHFLTLGVQYRKEKAKELIKKIVKEANKQINILNIGCGSSRDIRELLLEDSRIAKQVSFSCLDQDEEALKASREFINEIDKSIKVNFINEDILTLIGLGRKELKIVPQDVIYSLGVADYFLKTTLSNFIKGCCKNLKPRGKLIFALCSSHKPEFYVHLRWFCEWNFYINNANEIESFIRDELNIKKGKIIWEKQNLVFFVMIER